MDSELQSALSRADPGYRSYLFEISLGNEFTLMTPQLITGSTIHST